MCLRFRVSFFPTLQDPCSNLTIWNAALRHDQFLEKCRAPLSELTSFKVRTKVVTMANLDKEKCALLQA